MNLKQIKQWLQCLGADTAASVSGEWVQCTCILAPWRHEKGTDSNPSLGIRISKKAAGQVHCFACDFGGDQMDLLRELKQLVKSEPPGQEPHQYDFAGAMKMLVDAEEDAPLSLGDIGDYEEDVTSIHKDEGVMFPESWLNSFPQSYGHPYLQTRDGGPVPFAVAKALDLRYDPYRKRVCFPIRDRKGFLRGFHGRDVTGESPLKYLMYTYHKETNPMVWLGEHWVDFDRPVVIAESVFDLARIYQVYRNVVCPLTASIGPEKIKRMGDAMEVFCIMDEDKAGQRASDKLQKYLPGTVFKVVHLPEGCKDPGAMSVHQVALMLEPHLPLDDVLV